MSKFEKLIILLILIPIIGAFIPGVEDLLIVKYLPFAALLLTIVSYLIKKCSWQMIPVFIVIIVMSVIRVFEIFNIILQIPMFIIGKLTSILLVIMTIYFYNTMPTHNLPTPTGKYPVGVAEYDMTDVSRIDPHFEESNEKRKLNVRIWYPAQNIEKLKPEPYLEHSLAQGIKAFGTLGGVAYSHFNRVFTNSYYNAEVADVSEKFPVVVYSHGSNAFNFDNTVLFEELASNGYVVFSVSHTHFSHFTRFTNGEIQYFADSQLNLNGYKDYLHHPRDGKSITDARQRKRIEHWEKTAPNAIKLHEVNKEDCIFVIDELIKMNDGVTKSFFKDKLDANKIAAMGMSFGGATSYLVGLDDERVKAIVSLDGTITFRPISKGLDVPVFTTLSNQFVDYYKTFGEIANKESYILYIQQSDHIQYTDFAILSPKINKNPVVGGKETNRITNEYVLGFLNKHIKNMDVPLLDKEVYGEISPSIQSYCKQQGIPYDKSGIVFTKYEVSNVQEN